MTKWLALAVAASALLSIGLVMMKSRAAELPVASRANFVAAIAAWLATPMWIGGLGVQVLGFALYLVVLSHSPVSIVAVMMQGGIAFFVLLSVVVLGERARAREWIGIGVIVLAMATLAASGAPVEDTATFGAQSFTVFVAIVMILGALPSMAPALRTNGSAAALMSGAAFGLGSVAAKAMTTAFELDQAAPLLVRIVANPYAYCVVIFDVAGIVILQNSFHTARGLIAMPLSSALSNLVPIAGGVLAFDERLPSAPGAAAMRVIAFTLTIAASILLAGATEDRQSPAGVTVT